MSAQSKQPAISCSRFHALWMKKSSIKDSKKGSFVSFTRLSSLGLTSLGLVSLLALSGCATTSSRNQTAAADAQNAAYVDQQMSDLANSVDKSLKDLQHLERGDEGPRKNSPQGLAIGGAAGPNQSPYAMPMKAGLDTTLGQQQEAARIAQNKAMLSMRVKLDWEGGASEFLSALAGKVGYRYTTVGLGPEPHISIHVKDASVESVLSSVADQITKFADIHVDVDTRCISLAYH